MLVSIASFITLLFVKECTTMNDVLDSNGCTHLRKYEDTDDADFVIVGLFPVHGHTDKGGFRYNPNGIIWSEAFKYFVKQINLDNTTLKNSKVGYIIYDTCSERRLALSAILEIYLNRHRANLTFIGVIGDAASAISTAVSTLLSIDLIPQVSYASTSSSLSDKRLYPSFLRTIPSDEVQVKLIIDIVSYFNWTYVSVVSGDDAYGRIGMYRLVPELKKIGVCVAVEDVFSANTKYETKQIGFIIKRIQKTELSKVIILWAQLHQAKAFLKQAANFRLYDKIWIGTEGWGHHNSFLERDRNVVFGLIGIAPFSGYFPDFKRHFSNISSRTCNHNSWINDYFQLRNKQGSGPAVETFGQILNEFSFTNIGFVGDAVQSLAYALDNYLQHETPPFQNFQKDFNYSKYLTYVRNADFPGLSRGSRIRYDGHGDICNARYKVFRAQTGNNGKLMFKDFANWDNGSSALNISHKQWIWPRNSTKKPTSKCSDVCLPGHYAIVQAPNCCWKCVPCEDGYYNKKSGNKHCLKCPVKTISNINRTACLPLTPIYFKLNSVRAIFLFILSNIGGALALFTAVVFFKNSETRIVRSSNYKMSLVQLVCLTILYYIPVLFAGKPNKSICIVRTSIPSLLITVAIAITFVKTEYLLQIFRAKTLLSKKVVFISKTLEIASVTLFFVLQVGFSIVLNFIQQSEVLETIRKEESQILITCNMTLLHLLEVLFLFLLALACFVQAFRARYLPENYNEAMRITFAMLGVCLSLFLTMLFYVSLSDKSQRYFATCLIIILGNYNMMYWLYYHKMKLILSMKEKKRVPLRIKTFPGEITCNGPNSSDMIIPLRTYGISSISSESTVLSHKSNISSSSEPCEACEASTGLINGRLKTFQ